MSEPVLLTQLKIYAKAEISVYMGVNGGLWLDPATTDSPLFRLGDIKGDTGAAGVAGAAGIQGVKGDTGAAGIQGVKGETGAAGVAGAAGKDSTPAVKLTGPTLNNARAGVIAGLDIQSVDSTVALIGAVVVFRVLLKLVSTATGNGSMQANIGGLIFTFPNIAIAASTQYLNIEVTAHVISSAVGFASVRQSIALNGVAANAVQSNNVAQSGSSVNNTALIQFKSPITTQVTTLFAVTEIL